MVSIVRYSFSRQLFEIVTITGFCSIYKDNIADNANHILKEYLDMYVYISPVALQY